MKQGSALETNLAEGARLMVERVAASLAAKVPALGVPPDPIEDQWTRIGAKRLQQPFVSESVPGAGGGSIPDAIRAAQTAGTRLRAFAEVFEERMGWAGAAEGPLAGLAFAFKDVFATDRRVPEAGTGRPWPNLAGKNSPVVAALEGAGAVALGATNLDPWCYATLGLNPLTDSALHPADPDLVVGGSSSGSAVAVSAGIIPFALGTDTGGSTRIPAALCGVFGFKPTNGLIPTTGIIPLSRSHDCVGVLARDAQTIARVLNIVVPPDSPIHHRDRRAPAIGIARSAFASCDARVQAALQTLEGSLALAGALAAEDVELPDLSLCNDAATVITAVEAYSALAGALAADPDAFPQPIQMRLAVGRLSAPETYARAQRFRASGFPAVMATLFADADLVMVPVTRRAELRISEIEAGGDAAYLQANIDLLYFNRWVNLFGLPSLTVPVRGGEGELLAGVQIIGRPYADFDLIEIASRFPTA